MKDKDYPALFRSADLASINAQTSHYRALKAYLILLILAAATSFYFPENSYAAISSASLFLVTLSILIWTKVKKPEETWYNGRAVAESVKTRTWRWVMRAEPFARDISEEQAQKELLNNLKSILNQNRSLSEQLDWTPDLGEAITESMKQVRNLGWEDRLKFYIKERIDSQSLWYSKKSQLNKRLSKLWFMFSIFLHALAVLLLLYRIKEPTFSLPVEVIATAATGALTWVQSKKFSELKASYSLAAHEIVLIKGESVSILNEKQLSDFVISSELAFSREHTQWSARRND